MCRFCSNFSFINSSWFFGQDSKTMLLKLLKKSPYMSIIGTMVLNASISSPLSFSMVRTLPMYFWLQIASANRETFQSNGPYSLFISIFTEWKYFSSGTQNSKVMSYRLTPRLPLMSSSSFLSSFCFLFDLFTIIDFIN